MFLNCLSQKSAVLSLQSCYRLELEITDLSSFLLMITFISLHFRDYAQVLEPVPYPASRPTSLWTNAMTPMPVASRPFLNHERNPAKRVKARHEQVTCCSLTRSSVQISNHFSAGFVVVLVWLIENTFL